MSAWLLGCAAVVSETAMDWKGDPGSDGKEDSVLLLPPFFSGSARSLAGSLSPRFAARLEE